ncbi:hypothetical protein Lgra_1340 [Legionella gratiana]|uniref:Uncharacterized protein n=1 Tax=Legionella gratiana TaxID=45066 RepID=A0A378JGP8_9GAMM|nr:hypothetical protein [Legionella gratiana]KTD11882.1 hypothetical protein Lgra_1340 [Legionella gratiana]STX46526.1 Uncharacterised protein [Legionella gratiana]
MLKDWQIKFPHSFAQFPNLFIELDFEKQETLSQLLHLIEQTGRGLLDEDTVLHILNNSSYLSELTSLIILISDLKCLNKSMLNHLFTNHFLPDLQESLDVLSNHTIITAEAVTFLFSTRNPQDCVGFMMRALQKGVDLTGLLNYLSRHVALEGLNRAITLFDLSSFSYRKEHFSVFCVITEILANPLCQTIFDARWRSFSDYTIISEPLSATDADEIIRQLIDVVDEETRIRTFFDFFASFRPFPPSQKYMVDVNISDKVTAALTNYCKSIIAAIANDEDSLQVREAIATLRKKGGNKIIFDKIKYEIASDVESEDLYSMRTYDDLMDEIWVTLNQPQLHLETFDDKLHKGRRYPSFFTEALRQQSFRMDTVSQDMMDIEQKDKTDNVPM